VPNSSVLKVRLAGTGGQGIIKASIILATAVVLDGRRVVQSQSYGPEARGGSCKADVIVSDEDILYPRIDRPNVLLCLSEAAYAKYLPGIADDAVVILNESLSSATNSGSRAYKVPITTIAREKLGAEITSNIVALGVIVGITSMVSEDSIYEAVKDSVPSKVQALNLKALTMGLDEGKLIAQCYRA
jgi:2-oxoglutarate ferredoxin oxidoreductase subunit gamma